MFFVAAILARTSAYAQTEIDYLGDAPSACPTTAISLSCTDDGLNPTPGKTYEYSVDVPTDATINWFVTTDVNVLTAEGTLTTTIDGNPGTYVLSAGTKTGNGDADYNSDTNTGTVLEVAWNYFDGTTTTVLLVAYVEDAAGCTDNIEVWKIEPIHKFALDIIALNDDGTDGTDGSECVSPIQEATYSSGVLSVDYGTNYVYFQVRAANFVGSWMPTFVTTNSSVGTSVVGDPEWAYPADAQTTGAWNAASVAVQASGGATAAVDDVGECIIVRIPVDHGTNEFATANGTVALDVSGNMYNGTDYDSLEDVASDCTEGDTDEATYTITPRPNVTNETPAVETKTGI